MPAWLVSLVVHFVTFAVLGYSLDLTPEGAMAEASRTGGIVLVQRSAGKAEYFAEDESSDAPTAAGTAASATTSAALPGTETPPALHGPQLPSGEGLSSAALPAGLPNASALAERSGLGGGPLGRGGDYGAETQVFGVKGKGSKFVYVFDRSASMTGYEGRPLAGAKRELIASLESLQSVHQFQILFYNEKPELMTLFRGQAASLVYADDRSKQLAARYIGGISAFGSTKHMPALRMALQMQPDVIFFLTDADEPTITRSELDELRRRNRGTVINAIEFGSGPDSGRHSFLRQLAAENDGQHGYVDVTKLER